MEIQMKIFLSTDNSIWAQVARFLGAEFTHSGLLFLDHKALDLAESLNGERNTWYKDGLPRYHIIEAGFRDGVIERAWNPDEYSKWAVYRLTDKAIKARLGYVRHPEDIYDGILAYARGNIGKRYAYEKLALLLPRFIREATSRRVARFDRELYRFTILGTGQVCTSLVDDCFLQGGHIDLVPYLDTPWVLPSDIASSPLLELLPPEGTVEWRGEA